MTKFLTVLNVVGGLLKKLGFFDGKKLDVKRLVITVAITLGVVAITEMGVHMDQIKQALDFSYSLIENSEVSQ